MASWAPLLYARTLHDDTWWRAAPHDRTQDPWLAGQVRIVVAGGHDLDRHSRFLLAHDGESWLFGVACLSERLSSTMNQTGGRPTYCFVGWVSEPWADPAAIPPWKVLTTRWVSWAAVVYDRWLAPDWALSASDRAGLPHLTPYAPLAGSWPADAGQDDAGTGTGRDQLTPVSLLRHGTDAWPMSDAARLWAAAAASAERITAVFGVVRAQPQRLRGITHAAVLELARRQLVPGPAEPAGQQAKAGDGPEPRSRRGPGIAQLIASRLRGPRPR